MERIFTIRLSSSLLTGVLLLSSITISKAYNGNPDLFLFTPFTAPNVCELVCPTDSVYSLNSGECEAFVTYSVSTTGLDCGASVPVQTAGLPSGSFFPIGVTQNCFTIDLPPLGLPDGDVSCCFNVTVLEYDNPTPFLVCNDLVFISLDDDCQTCISAAAILEGGPYGCFDNYLVEIDKTAPFGNGPWVPACVGITDINKTYQVRITDPETNNKCWGNVKIEDKVAPVLACATIELPCNFSSFAPGHVQTASFTAKYAPAPIDLPKILIPGDSFVFNIPVSADAVVNDVDCRVNITNANAWNIQIEVISPAGSSALIWDGVGGCGLNTPIFVRFDDEGAPSNQCADLNSDLNLDIMSVLGFDSLETFDGENAQGIWKIKVSNPDLQGFDYVAVVEIAELYLDLTGQIAVGFPNALSGNCVQAIGNNQFLVPAGCGTPQLDNCSNVTLSYQDTETPEDCPSGFTGHIDRTWTARDVSGNTATCIQRIDQLRPTLNDVVLPPNYDGIDAAVLPCVGAGDPTPEWIESLGLQGSPWAFGSPEGCSILWSYADNFIPVCDGTFKISRAWTIFDFCTGEVLEHTQILKVTDNQGPTFTCPANKTVSTDPFACCATTDIPDLIISDDCSRIGVASGAIAIFDASGQQIGLAPFFGALSNFPGNDLANPDTLAAFGMSTCLPLGAHTVGYLVEDDCGNTATCSFQLTVIDNVPPVAICDENFTVAIGLDNPNDCFGPEGPNGVPAALGACEFGGISWVNAKSFDDGSYDVCTGNNIKFTIRRKAPYSDCILALNATNGNTPCNDAFPDFPSEFERAISEGDSIKFYSCEVGTTQTVILKIYQLTADGSIALDANGAPLANECEIQVLVEDKIKPVCVAPANVSISCEQFDPSLSSLGSAGVFDNCCLDANLSYQGQCGLVHSANYANFDTLCNLGTIVRMFRAYDCEGNSSQCTQQVVVNYDQHYFIKFPNDVIVTECSTTGNYGEPTFFGEDCELLGRSYQDEVFTIVPDACYKIERTWTIINWCTFNPGLPPTVIPNPQPNAIPNDPSNLPGPIVSDCNAPAPWNPSMVKINPTDPMPTNYCTFWSPDANSYQYKQIIKIIDTQEPVIANCPASTITVTDSSQNESTLWNNVFNPNLPAQDLKEAGIDLSITSSDDCNLSGINYQLFLDLDNDGTLETVVLSDNQPGADTIRYNSVNTPGFLGGTAVTFDSRPVPTDQKWHFDLESSTNGNNTTTSVRWNTEATPNAFVTPQLPVGTHKIKWIVADNCGNQANCEYTFTIQSATSGIETLDEDGFALYQNAPNPFAQNTSIGFHLPQAAEATLSVFDTEGRLLFVQTGDFKQGNNTIQIAAEGLQTPGMLYYKLESGAHVAWRKMVLIR